MEKIKTGELGNGLKYVMAPMAGVKSVTVLCLVEAGTRFETEMNNGISHFLEHMVFKGTKKYPKAMDIALEVDKVGGVFNAFTGKEYTGFYVKTSIDHIEMAMSIISSLVFEPKIPSKDLETERGVILEEIKMYEDLPQSKVEQVFEEIVFKNSTLGWDTLGKEKVIRSVLRKDFKDYMNLLYVPNRMLVSVAGGLSDNKKTKEMIEKYFGQERERVVMKREDFKFKQNKARKKIIEKGTEQTHLIYGYRSFGRGDENRYKMAVMSTILGGGMSSRLFTEIREKRGLVYYVGTTAENYCEDGYLAVKAGTSKDTAEKVVELAELEFNKIKNKKISEIELTKVKEYIKGHLILSMEDSYQVANFVGEDMLLIGKFRTIEEILTKIDRVTASEVMALAQQIFVEEKRNLAMIR